MRFPVVKLLHFANREAEPETNPNPFALLTLAYLQKPRHKDHRLDGGITGRIGKQAI